MMPLLGGVLIGLGASLLLLLDGEVAGISGILAGILRPRAEGWGWRTAFVIGLVAGGALIEVLRPQLMRPARAPLPLLAVAGVLVGIGTRLGGGCTSGHGVCGVARRSRRSIAATALFVATGMLVLALRHLPGFVP